MSKNKLIGRILAFVAIVACLAALSGCSQGDQIKLDPKNPVEIVVWHYYHGAQKSAFDDAVREFNETVGFEQGIIVEAISQGGVSELAANVMAAATGELDAGAMPNIFGAYGDAALEILNMGMVAEIDAYISPEELSEYEDSFIHEGRIGLDKLYVFPIAKSTESLMLNKTDFDAFVAGLKKDGWQESAGYDDFATWEGLLEVADLYYRYTDSLTPEENDGKALFGLDSLANYVIVGSKQLGQDLVKVEHGEASINLDPDIMSKLWYTYYEPMVTGRFAKLGKFCSDDIKTGDSLCFIGSTASASYFPTELTLDSGESKFIEMIVLPMPVFANGEKVAISQGAGMVISKASPEKEYASAIFLKWFTGAQRNISFSLGSSYLPVKKEALDEALLNEAFSAIENGDVNQQNSVQALRVGVDQLRSYTLYSSDVFDGSQDFRYTIPVVLENAVAEGRSAYLAALENGVAPEQAYAELEADSAAKFEEWINSLKR